MPYNSDYKYMGRTSMSNPIVAGGVTVIRDYYNKAYGLNASAALVKATLINSAVDMADENNDGVNDNDFPIPNMHEGWGRVNLDGATDGTIPFVDEGTGLSTGGSQSFSVSSSRGPLKVTLVWLDYPSTDTASVNLVNDLDLTVTGPSGTYRGNVFSGGSADRRNNVKNVYVQNAAAGTYTVTVAGFNIPNGPQRFALAVDGGSIGTGPTPSATPSPTPTSTPASSTSTGFLPPSAQAPQTSNAGDNNGCQTNPANAFVDDGLVATDLDSGTCNKTACTDNGKDKHFFHDLNFNIPSTAVIQGLQVRLDARTENTKNSPRICVQISWEGGSTWTNPKETKILSTTEATYMAAQAIPGDAPGPSATSPTPTSVSG